MHAALSMTQMYKSLIRANNTSYYQETPQAIDEPSHTTGGDICSYRNDTPF